MPFQVKLFHVFFLGFAAVLLCIGGSAAVSKLRFERTAVAAKGRVVRLEEKKRSKGSIYAPVVVFLTHDEQEITFTSSFGNRPPAFQMGEEVTVLYDPENPRHAYIHSFMQFWGVAVLCLGMGSMLAALPTIMLVGQARRSRLAGGSSNRT